MQNSQASNKMSMVVELWICVMTEIGSSCIGLTNTCPETRVITHARVHIRAESPTRAKNHLCQHDCQPCSRTCQLRIFVVATATLVTVTFCCHNSVFSFFILNGIFEMVQQQGLCILEIQILDRTCNSK